MVVLSRLNTNEWSRLGEQLHLLLVVVLEWFLR